MIKFCGNSKSTGVRCAADRIEHQVKASEWLSCPVAGDGAEQPMFDVIPFGGPARVVANGYCNAIFVGPSLKFTFPESRAMPIAAATVGRDQQFGCVGILLSSPTLPPTPNRTHSKLWRVGRRSNANVPSLLGHVVNAVRDCPAFGISRKSYTDTASASSRHNRPSFLKLPISSVFLVSTLMVGKPFFAKRRF